MSIYSIEQASAFGAFDGDTIASGRALDAHTARAMARQANRHFAKRQQILNLVWSTQERTINETAQYDAEWIAPLEWEAILPPHRVLKKPGAERATAYIRVRGDSGPRVDFRIGTLAQDSQSAQIATASLTGGWDDVSIDIAMAPGDSEEITLYAKSRTEGALLNTGPFGSPASGTVGGDDVVYFDRFLRDGATWALGGASLASAGHYLRYFDGPRILGQGLITAVDFQASTPNFGRQITHWPIWNWQEFLGIAHAGRLDFEILTGVPFSLAQVLVVLGERSL